MINVTLGKKDENVKPFPKLMKYLKTQKIVFFVDERKGLVIVKDEYHCFGFYTEDWIMDYFTDYNEPITIQNA